MATNSYSAKATFRERVMHWLGYEFLEYDQRLITMNCGRCRICGKRFVSSMFGLFEIEEER